MKKTALARIRMLIHTMSESVQGQVITGRNSQRVDDDSDTEKVDNEIYYPVV